MRSVYELVGAQEMIYGTHGIISGIMVGAGKHVKNYQIYNMKFEFLIHCKYLTKSCQQHLDFSRCLYGSLLFGAFRSLLNTFFQETGKKSSKGAKRIN